MKKRLIGAWRYMENMMNHEVEVMQLDSHTWMLSEGTSRGRTHCYLLEGDEFAILIDTGLNIVQLKEITATLTTKEVRVLNTHGHLDHIANNHQFTMIYMQPSDADILKEHSSSELRSQFLKKRYIDKGYTHEQLQSSPIQDEIKTQAVLPQSVAFTPVYDGMRIDMGGRSIQIISTAGHTRGSICVLDEAYQRLYSGDTICEEGVLLLFPYSTSVQVFLTTLQKLNGMRTTFNKIYGGHQKVPLSVHVIDDLIACATAILQGRDHPIINESAAGIGYVSTYQNATISYVPSNIKEN